MFRIMLNRHPSIRIFGEFEEAVSQLGDDGWIPLEKYYDFLRDNRSFRTFGLTINSQLSYPDLVRDLFLQRHKQTIKPYIGAAIHSRFDRLPDIWPGAKYIFLRRDPRDVAKSCQKMGWTGNTFYGADYWINAEKRLEKLQRRVGEENILIVRYEDLLVNLEYELARVCSFIGVPYSDEMLSYDERSTYDAPDPSFCYQWRRNHSKRDISLTEAACGGMLVEAGYEPSGYAKPSLNALARLFLWLEHRIWRIWRSIEDDGFIFWISLRLSERLPFRGWRSRMRLERNERVRTRLK